MLTTPVDPRADAPAGRTATALAPIWAWTLSVALLGSWTCFDALPGLNWTLWTLAAAAGILVLRRRFGGASLGGPPGAALALACGLAGSATITADPHADALIFLTVAALFGYAILSLLREPERLGPAALMRSPLTLGRRLGGEVASTLEDTLAAARMQGFAPMMRGGVMAVALAGALFLLLSAADPVLADWRDAAWSGVRTVTFLAHDLFFLGLALVLLGGYGLCARPAPTPIEPPDSGRRALFSDLERLMVLGAAFALFALFFALELATRFGLSGSNLTEALARGETLAQATHRGFGEMIAAALLSASVIIALDRRARRGERESRVLALSWMVIAAALLLVGSAWLRVRFYEASEGYTEPRICVQLGCAAVLAALLLLAWQLRAAAASGTGIDLPRLTRRFAGGGVACVAILGYWNSAGWIVSANIQRYERTGRIDVAYLARLARSSPDAVPAVIAGLRQLPPSDVRLLRAALRRGAVEHPLFALAGGGHRLEWYEWSLRRSEALSALGAAGPSGSPLTR